MNLSGCFTSWNILLASSSSKLGQKGWNQLRFLKLMFNLSLTSNEEADARMLRFPSALGPYSILPWNHSKKSFLFVIMSAAVFAMSLLYSYFKLCFFNEDNM